MGPEVGILRTEAGELPEIARPEATQLFLMDEGVHLSADPRLLALLDAGLEVTVCAMDAEARGVPLHPGIRAGSQYDHAVMMRDAKTVLTSRARFVPGPRTPRIVAVHLQREPSHGKTAQGLRSAVAYAACRLDVRLVVSPEAASLLEHGDHPAAVVRPLATLRGLGVSVTAAPPPDCDIEVSW
jgi:hypothetical protein